MKTKIMGAYDPSEPDSVVNAFVDATATRLVYQDKPKARMSSLPVLQFCGQGQLLSAKGGGSRSSAIGTAFHAVSAGAPEARELMARLSDEEREQLQKLIRPQPVKAAGGALLTYEDAQKELAVAITAEGLPTEYGADDALLQGTLDMAWLVEEELGKVAYVGDIKKTSYAEPDGAFSLQVKGYALAVAARWGADGYCTGIWDATAGEWEWAPVIDMFSEEALLDKQRVLAAAQNLGGEFNMGAHCFRCYARSRCPQWLLPMELAETTLAPFTEPDLLTPESAREALLTAERVAATAEEVKKILKHWANENGGIPNEEGTKVWAPSECKGRPSIDSKQLELDHPHLVERYYKRGAPYKQFRWKNKK